MKIQFEYTLDDTVDYTERSLARSKTIGTARLQGFFVFFLLGGLFGYVISSSSDAFRLMTALTTGAVGGSIHLLTQTSARKRKILKLSQEYYGLGPFDCEIEITAAALIIKQIDTQIIRSWKIVTGVEEADHLVEIIMKDSLLCVPDRAFQSPEERQQFVSLSRQYAEQSYHSQSQNVALADNADEEKPNRAAS